jgi:hypothetical protein
MRATTNSRRCGQSNFELHPASGPHLLFALLFGDPLEYVEPIAYFGFAGFRTNIQFGLRRCKAHKFRTDALNQ